MLDNRKLPHIVSKVFSAQKTLPKNKNLVINAVTTSCSIDSASNNRMLTTKELALLLSMSAQSIRKRYCETGSYFHLKPIKLPNRRLLWPADAVELLVKWSLK